MIDVSLMRRVPALKGDYSLIYSNLYDAVVANDPNVLEVKPEQVIDVLRIVDMVMKSSKEGREIKPGEV